MSRSYRKPYAAITGTASAKDDKTHAARGVRHTQNRYLERLARAQDWDSFSLPHRLECPWNEVYSWGRDGKQYLHFPARRGGRPDPDGKLARYAHDYWLKLLRK